MALLFALIIAAASILLAVTVLWVLSLYLKDNSIIDVFYGPICAVTAFVLVVTSSVPHPVTFLMLMLIMVWALRLSLRIARKNISKNEDQRYGAWRVLWMKRGYSYFALRSLLQVFLLQGVVIYVVLLPFTLVISVGGATYPAVLLLGVALWCVGFFLRLPQIISSICLPVIPITATRLCARDSFATRDDLIILANRLCGGGLRGLRSEASHSRFPLWRS